MQVASLVTGLSGVLKVYAKQAAKQRRTNGVTLMVSEINGTCGGVVTALTQSAAKTDKPVNPVAKPASAGSEDVVQLTDLGTRLQELTQAVAEVPEVDRARVGQVRQALADGAYQVEPEAIADKLIAMEELLGSGQKP